MRRHIFPQGSLAQRPALGRVLLAVLLGFTLALLGCRDPQQPVDADPESYRGIYNPSRVTIEFRLESSNGDLSALRLVATNLRFDSETSQVHASVAIHNGGDAAVPGPDAITVSDFTPRDVRPLNAACPVDCAAPDSVDCIGPCTYDHRGTYGDDGMLEVGETSEPIEWILLNRSGQSFAFRARLGGEIEPADGVISGVVFGDRNNNGERENDEPGIPGAHIGLVFGDDVRTTETDIRGRYRFSVTEPGLYRLLWRVAPDDCEPTTPKSMQVAVLRRADGSLSSFAQGDFGCRATTPNPGVPVTGFVYVDANGNGQRDADEAGVSNVLVVGSAAQCPTFVPIEARTDARGHYSMRLPDCDPPYIIHRAAMPGFVDTSPNPLVFETRPPAGGALRADFGVSPEGPLPEYFVEGVVFLDANHNGFRDSDEPGVEGVEVTASGLICLTPVLAHTRTDALGRYRLRGADVHCPLPWLVQRHGPWADTTPNPVILRQPPPDGSTTFHLDFGVAPRDSVPPPIPSYAIEGVVFADLDRNGMRSQDEPGIAGVEVQLLSPCDVLRLARTDMHGRYRFSPDVVIMCPVTGVWQSRPTFVANTTPNPFPVDPNSYPGPLLIADFGVVPQTTEPR